MAVSRAAALYVSYENLCSYVPAVSGYHERYLMSLCPYVLLFAALAAAKQCLGASPLRHRYFPKKAVNTDFTGIIRLDYQHIYTH